MLPKGFRLILSATILLVASQQVSAQVYRCEGDSGVTYSDLPCGETAEVIQLEGIAPLSRDDAQDDDGKHGEASSASATVADDREAGDLNTFLEMLQSQRDYQIGEIDMHLDNLRAQTGTKEFLQQDEAVQQEITDQIAALESNKASILDEYQSLIAEARSRLD